MANGTYAISPFTPSKSAASAADDKVFLFPIRRDELRDGKADGDGPAAADFAPRWWPAPECDLELD